MIAWIEDSVVIRKILNHLQEKSSLDSVVGWRSYRLAVLRLMPKYVYLSITTHKKSRYLAAAAFHK